MALGHDSLATCALSTTNTLHGLSLNTPLGTGWSRSPNLGRPLFMRVCRRAYVQLDAPPSHCFLPLCESRGICLPT